MNEFVASHYYTVLTLFLSFVFLGNIPVGRLRARFPKFSRPWARCIYVPILVNIILRRLIGLAFKVVPLVLLAVVLGQVIGARLARGKAAALAGDGGGPGPV